MPFTESYVEMEKCIDYLVNADRKPSPIEEFISFSGVGIENAVSAEKIMQHFGIPTRRALRKEIAKERENDALILSTTKGGGGYFLPDTGEKGRREIARCANMRASAALRSFNEANRLFAHIKNVPAQQILETLCEGKNAET